MKLDIAIVMVRNRKLKPTTGVYDSHIMERAVQEVVQNDGKILTVAKDYGIDRTILRITQTRPGHEYLCPFSHN